MTVSRSHAIFIIFACISLMRSDRPTTRNRSQSHCLSPAESRCGCLKEQDTVESASGSFLIDVPIEKWRRTSSGLENCKLSVTDPPPLRPETQSQIKRNQLIRQRKIALGSQTPIKLYPLRRCNMKQTISSHHKRKHVYHLSHIPYHFLVACFQLEPH